MSRYNLTSLDPNLDVVCGYDPCLSTYFANVVKPAPADASFDENDPSYAEDENLLMVGNRVAEIDSVDKLANLIQNYASIPDEIQKKMVEDHDQPYELSPLQRMMRDMKLTI